MGEFLIGLFIGFVASFVITISTNTVLAERRAVVNECEAELPRNQSCKYVITAIKEDL